MRERVLVPDGSRFLGGHLPSLADVEAKTETFSPLAGSEVIVPRAKGQGRHTAVQAH